MTETVRPPLLLPAELPPLEVRADHPALRHFHEPVRTWFAASFDAPTRAQELSWPLIAGGSHTLLQAPTGSGKTLAAFLAAIDHLMFAPAPPPDERCRVLYVSPLKALAVDVERNLRAPLVGVSRYAERMGVNFHLPEVAIRTGDTPQRERAQFARKPSDILITTPESLFLLLTSNTRDALRSVRWVILDEIHAMLATKRGAHLALTLERLEELVEVPLQRIGLSATVRPADEAARFLGGFVLDLNAAPQELEIEPAEALPVEDEGEQQELVEDAEALLTGEEDLPLDTHAGLPALAPRPVSVADAGGGKRLELTVEVPVEDMAKLGQVEELSSGPASITDRRTSIWPAIYPLILEQVKQHRSTLIFVNSRRLAERLAGALNELAGEEMVRAHHGSVAREQRAEIEDALKAGRLPALVATSSLELGIDMGAIDLVIQVEAPPSIASALQRVGRAGHQIGAASEGVIIPKYRGDLLACAALTERMRNGSVEPLRYPRNPLDILAQQIVAMVGMEDWRVDDLAAVIRRAAPFTELPRSLLEGVLDMLSGRYPSDDFAELRPRVTWDRLAGTLTARQGARRLAVTNGGTIPDRGLYGVYLATDSGSDRKPTSQRVGELDEEMVFETHVGETFILGATTWRVEQITHDRVLVTPAPGEVGKMPFWKGDTVGRPLEFGRAIGNLCRTLRETTRSKGRGEAQHLLMERHSLTEGAARNLLQYLEDQHSAVGAVPDDKTIVVERYLDEMGDWRVCLLSPFGGRVHSPWAMAIEVLAREQNGIEIEVMWADDGIVARFPEADEPPPLELVIPDPDEVEELVIRQLGQSAQFAARFREASGRALLLPRRYPGQRAPLWQQRKKSADLLQAASEYGSFPLILEAYRECLRDVFDIPALVELLRDVRRRAIRTVPVTTRAPSPFAASLLFSYVGNFMYDGDAPLAEIRAQALTVDQTQLRELLGEVELRDLLDGDALAELELQLQCLAEGRRVRHGDGLHDLLLRLGDLNLEEIQARSAPAEGDSPEAWIDTLMRARRIVALRIAGDVRYIAAEDVGRFRDALGIPPPPGLPAAFLEFTRDPVSDLVARYARTHGPFHAEDMAARWGCGVGPILTTLRNMATSGRMLEGAFRPGGSGAEWCDAGVLRSLRQKSLARLRKEVEPVEPGALGRLYLAWQGIGRERHGGEALLEVIEQLQGAALPASDLETRILPARLPEFDPHELDELTAAGMVFWLGVEPLGDRDGRVALYLAEHLPLLANRRPAGPEGDLHDMIRAHLAARGASFFTQILQACGGGGAKMSAFAPEVLDALWDLVWAGEVTNDTLQPLRAYLHPRRRPGRSSGYSASRGLRGRALMPPESAGRWSLVSSLVFGEPTATERLTARAGQLLERHGVLTREAVQAEGIEGGFSAVYPVLRALEEAGRVRRGYFVAGRGATQFALPGAVERLRSLREPPASSFEEDELPKAVVLAATDPANPYGAALPWPLAGNSPGEMDGAGLNGKEEATAEAGDDEEEEAPKRRTSRRPARAAGATVVLLDGALVGWMGRAERGLLTFLDQTPDRDPEDARLAMARALAGEVGPGKRRRALFIREVDGVPVQETPWSRVLADAGFTFGPHGYMKRA